MRASELSASHRARLFSTLIQISNQPGSWDKILKECRQHKEVDGGGRTFGMAVANGQYQAAIVDKLRDLGRFLPWELTLIELGLATGNTQDIFKRIREHYQLRDQFHQEFKRRLRWPLLVVMGILMAVLTWGPVEQQLGIIGVGTRLLIFAAVVVLLLWGVERCALLYRAGVLPTWLVAVSKCVPVLHGLLQSEQTYHYLKNIQQCTQCGLPLQRTLELSAAKIPDPSFIDSYMAVHHTVRNGQKLSAALLNCGILNGIAMPPMLKVNASAVDAQQHLSDAAYSSYIQCLWHWTFWLPQLLYILLPLVALLNLLTI